jgi:hypothetical protein
MDKLLRWISAEHLMERWNLEPYELKQIPIKGYIPGSPEQVPDSPFEYIDVGFAAIVDIDALPHDLLLNCVFKRSDVYNLEKKHPELRNEEQGQISKKEKKELGQLRNEKSKWDDSIKASFQIGIYCRELSEQDKKITHSMLDQKIFDLGFKDLPDSTIELIWKGISENYRQKAGRPRKRKDYI